MIPKQAIEKAIEGGWQHEIKDFAEYALATFNPSGIRWQVIALDKTFWQALGKALGWVPDYALEAGWGHYAHMFYRLIHTGGDTEKFWADLLNV